MGAGAGAGGDLPPVAPGRGPGWEKLAEAVAQRVSPTAIETIYLFRPWKREGREWGTAVVACRGTDASDRLRVYTARYMLIVRGKERGQSRVEIEETGLSPAQVIRFEGLPCSASVLSYKFHPTQAWRAAFYAGFRAGESG